MENKYPVDELIRKPEFNAKLLNVYKRAIEDYDTKSYDSEYSDWQALLGAGILEEFMHAMKFPEKGGMTQFSGDKLEAFRRRVEDFIKKRRANGYLR